MLMFNLGLAMAVVCSALYLVNLQYESRHLYAELDRAQTESRQVAVENNRLQLEKRSQSNSSRVAKLAKSQLQMVTATPEVTVYVDGATGHAGAPVQSGVKALWQQ
jgi:cell division protein FtsL